MTLIKMIRMPVAALGLTVLSAGFAYAQTPAGKLGSVDIYTTNFQKTFADGNPAPQSPGKMGALGSVDMYSTNFQKTFADGTSAPQSPAKIGALGSVDIYTTNFQKTL